MQRVRGSWRWSARQYDSMTTTHYNALSSTMRSNCHSYLKSECWAAHRLLMSGAAARLLETD